MLAQEKSEAAAIRAETISCLHPTKPDKQDLYKLASHLGTTAAEPEVLRAIPVDMSLVPETKKENPLPEKYVTDNGTLQTIQDSDTLNTIFSV